MFSALQKFGWYTFSKYYNEQIVMQMFVTLKVSYHTVKYGTFLPKHPVYNLQTK